MYLFKPVHKATNLHRSFPSGHCFLTVLPPCLHGIGKAMVAVQVPAARHAQLVLLCGSKYTQICMHPRLNLRK